MGISPSEFRRGNEILFDKGYGELSLNVGIFYNNVPQINKTNNFTDNSLDELLYSNLIKGSNKSKNIASIKKILIIMG